MCKNSKVNWLISALLVALLTVAFGSVASAELAQDTGYDLSVDTSSAAESYDLSQDTSDQTELDQDTGAESETEESLSEDEGGDQPSILPIPRFLKACLKLFPHRP